MGHHKILFRGCVTQVQLPALLIYHSMWQNQEFRYDNNDNNAMLCMCKVHAYDAYGIIWKNIFLLIPIMIHATNYYF